ncbi:hypothetical protein H9649_07340 [Sporosarcina sp. Sa2YVA2]|uniref:Uncharacterized protein n=1 Tax=Sporosarcina quadrami TaxID=2762234 RepID=A0ABR8U9K1_9BACL|nr:hypothetical protein [Sporosarcina quadrami]MBD7984388.1 hypothetical protein [Sporosarcina quadrami]
MLLFGNISIMALFPVTLLLLTMEIVFSSYKSTSKIWTTKLAAVNLIINLFWVTIIILLLLNPMIIHPFLSDLLASIFSRSPEDINTQVMMIIFAVGLLSLATTIIDSYVAFKKSKTDKSINTSEME